MTSPRDTLLKRIDRLTTRARAFLVWERYTPVLFYAVCAALIFIAGSFAGIWERIGDPWRYIALIAVLFLLARALWKARALPLPSKSAAARRVESDNGLSHRPFDTVRDAAADTADANIELWDAHSQSAATHAAGAANARLRPTLAPIDKYYLRFAVPAVVVLGLMLGTVDSFERLRRSLSPGWMAAIDASTAKYDAWIDPPDYTGRPPVYFKTRSKLEAPQGSEVVARVSGIKAAPRLSVIENGRSRRVSVMRLGPTSFEARTVLSQDAKLRWRIGSAPKTWRVDVLPDTAPDVQWSKDPEAGKRDTLDFSYDLSDDFGAVSLVLMMQRVNDIAQMGEDAAPVETIDIALSSDSVRRAQNKPESINLTKHVWASEKVVGTLTAKDFKGQIGRSEPRTFIVPDKIFISDLAKAAVENRALLLTAQDEAYKPLGKIDYREYPVYSAALPQERIERAPAGVQRAATLIDIVTDSPVGAFKDPVVYLGLKNVQSRLEQAREIEDISGTPEDLWLIAMRAEYGPLGNAKEAMMAAEAALRDGMARRARKREVDTLFTRYNDAVDRYMQYLMENAQEVDAEGGGGGGGRNADEIQALLDAIEEANRLGDTEGARRALAQLAELLENMQIQLTKGGEGEGGDSSPNDGLSEDVKEAIEDLADVIGEQRELQDETREAERAQEQAGTQSGEQPGQSPQSGQGSPGGQSGQQPGGAQTAENGAESSGEGGEDAPATPDQLAKNQATLQSAIDALEKALKDGGTDLSVIAEQGEAAGPGDDDGTQPGGGSSDDADAPEVGAGSNSDEPDPLPGSGSTDSEESSDDALILSPQEALDAARRAMAESQAALEGGALGEAGDAQSAAIEALKKAAESLIATGTGPGSEGGDQSAGRDPFGREAQDGGGLATGETEIPDVTDRQRARDLIEELRRRAADRKRPAEELDYLDRLLERF